MELDLAEALVIAGIVIAIRPLAAMVQSEIDKNLRHDVPVFG